METVYWDAGTARLLPRLIRGRTNGPLRQTISAGDARIDQLLRHIRPKFGRYSATLAADGRVVAAVKVS
ncbi:hypothetical protein [Nocardia albiluteola]|uniref:hypothetical protein n=1 Tax=Nocardia albiluteola TaxID=2842303 RepID=UPI001FD93E11|nr:hypothetical protein [Nocardia albiluteola]